MGSLWGQPRAKVVLLGLDGAGKTTILYRLIRGEQIVPSASTVGFNVEEVRIGDKLLQLWDVGNQTLRRSLYQHYYQNAAAVVYVIDSSKPSPDDGEYFRTVLMHPKLAEKSLLVLANKWDLAQDEGLQQLLSLEDFDCRLRFQRCEGTSGAGLMEGFSWLAQSL